MKALSKRLAALEVVRGGEPTSFDHVPDEALVELERLCAKSMLDYTADDVRFFQRFGFLQGMEVGPGTIREWLTREEVAYMEAKGA